MQVINVDVLDGQGLIPVAVGDGIKATRLEQFIRDAWAAMGKQDTCKSRYATRPILYTDTLDGEQVCRDDLWAITTDELNVLTDAAALPHNA